MAVVSAAERLQKVLSQLGLASRREAEAWIRAGRITVNGKAAVLGTRVAADDQLKLDGRPIRRQVTKDVPVFLCHRSPGEPLLPPRSAGGAASASSGPASNSSAAPAASIAERLPRRAGRRFISISPMPTVDGGLELLTADGALATRLQRAVHALEMEFSLRIRGELSELQQQAIREGMLDRGAALRVLQLEPTGGEGSNRWYRLLAVGASGNDIRQLIERQAVTLVRMLRTRVGTLLLPRTLARSHWRELEAAEVTALLGSPGSGR
ncbi:MAG TPA: S4 domain-containing protein [Steroidobacteraceae bacterium]|jgi:23S rRNA pseudouridine2605 synthase|nr:S4 domain-containing protein [Steroidobacteraceae bacterium]